jgi:hypothetical protein
MSKDGFASRNLFKTDGTHYSMFDVHQFLFRFDWTFAAGGDACSFLPAICFFVECRAPCAECLLPYTLHLTPIAVACFPDTFHIFDA